MTTTALRSPTKSPSAKAKAGATLGPWVAAWMERYLVHGEGDYYGKPFSLRPWQRTFVDQCYAIDANGRRKYDRVVLGLPKGNGKTELAAAFALAELAGPVVFDGWDARGNPKAKPRSSPDIPVAAGSFEQADLLFGACRAMVRGGVLVDHLDVFDTEIYPKHSAPGSLYKVAAVAGTNDGKRPTFFVADEVHEWEGKKERVHLVLSNGRAKRAGAWELSISTAGWDGESLLARLCARKDTDPRLLVTWFEAPASFELDDADQRMRAILAANPAAGDFLSAENIEARYHEIPEHEFRRYYLNQWTSVPEQWLTPEVWDAAEDRTRVVEDQQAVVLGFDGSYTRDSTALIGCTVERPHLFTIGIWERPEGVKEWQVDRADVEQAIRSACGKYRVVQFPADDTFGAIWRDVLAGLAEQSVPVGEWPTRAPSRMAPACGLFWGAIHRKDLTHDGNAVLRTHLMNCRTKNDRHGPRIVKEYKNSPKHIDAAVAAVIAHEVATNEANNGVSVYDSRDVRTF